MRVEEPMYYMTREDGDWISFPVSLFSVVRLQDLSSSEYQGSSVVWLESSVFPGMFLKVHSLKWVNSEWRAGDKYLNHSSADTLSEVP